MKVQGEHMREQRELRNYVITALVAELCSLSLKEMADGSIRFTTEPRRSKDAEGAIRFANETSKPSTGLWRLCR